MNWAELHKGDATLAAGIAVIIAMTVASVSVAHAQGHLVSDGIAVQPGLEATHDPNARNSEIRVTFETTAAIPTGGSSEPFGYAVLTESGNGPDVSLNNVLVLMSHLGPEDSHVRNPIGGFHTHVLDLMGPSTACAGADLEVDPVKSGGNAGFDLDTNWNIIRNVARIGPTPIEFLNANPSGAPGVEAIFAFTLEPRLIDTDRHLCVFVVDVLVPQGSS